MARLERAGLRSSLPPPPASRKAKLAQVESERLTLEADLSVLSSVAAKLKAAIARAQPKGAVRPVQLDRVEQRVFDGLDGGSVVGLGSAGGGGASSSS